MGDWPVGSQDFDDVFISTASPESVGVDYYALTAAAIKTSRTWFSANAAIYVPFVVGSPITAMLLWMFNGATVTGNVDIGIFTQGGTRLVSSGSTAQAGTSTIQSFDVTDTLLMPGAYYFALACSSASATVRSGLASGNTPFNAPMGVLKQATALPLPATATFAAITASDNSAVPLMGLAARTLV